MSGSGEGIGGGRGFTFDDMPTAGNAGAVGSDFVEREAAEFGSGFDERADTIRESWDVEDVLACPVMAVA